MQKLWFGIISLCCAFFATANTQSYIPVFTKNVVSFVPQSASSTPETPPETQPDVIYIPLRIGTATTFIPVTRPASTTPVDPPDVTPPSFPTTDLIAEYLFDDAADLGKDTSGNNRNGTLQGTLVSQNGLMGGAAQFSKAQYIEIPDSDALSINATGLTVSFWQYQADSKNWKGIVSKSDASHSEWYIDDAKPGSLDSLSAGLHNSNGETVAENKAISEPGVWAHYSVVFHGNSHNDNIDVYRNGVLTSSTTSAGATGYSNTSAPLTIGRSFDKSASQFHFFSGLMDNVRLYSRALPEHEVLGLFQEVTPPSPNTNALRAVDDYFTFGNPLPFFFGLFPLENDTSSNADSLRVTSVGAAANGSVVVYSNQLGVRYTPNTGYCGYDSFEYTVTDASNQTASATMHVVMECGSTNTRPVSLDDVASLERNTSITIHPLANDTDPDNHPLDVYLVNASGGSGNGTIKLNRDDSVTYTPNQDYCGSDVYLVHLRDAFGLETYGKATFNVACSNLRPTPQDDHVSTAQGTPVTISPLLNDTDPEGDTLAFAGAYPPNHGTIVNNLAAGTVTYTPNAEYCGPDYFSYDAVDPDGASWFAVIHVTVSCAVNEAPVAVADSATTDADTSVTINVLQNDSDPDNHTLSLVSVSTPTNGSTSVSGASVVYTPNAGYCGNDTFSYTIQDSESATASATVSVSVACSQEPATPLQLSWEPTTVSVGQPATLTWEFTGMDNCQISHSSSSAVSGQETLTLYEIGLVSATFKCTDTSGGVHNFNADITVNKLSAPTNLQKQ